jgi:hypothetical protein
MCPSTPPASTACDRSGPDSSRIPRATSGCPGRSAAERRSRIGGRSWETHPISHADLEVVPTRSRGASCGTGFASSPFLRKDGYDLHMQGEMVRRLVCVAVLCGFVGGVAGLPVERLCAAAQDLGPVSRPRDAARIAERLDVIVESIPSISVEVRLRRTLAHATFCLPQNVLGILYYGFLRVTGDVLGTREMNEMTIVVTGSPFGASLGRYLFVPASFLTEVAVRHEYGHAMQGYRHGPFYLLLEGAVSLIQAAISMISPSFAEGYFDRWPENEANELGGVSQGF